MAAKILPGILKFLVAAVVLVGLLSSSGGGTFAGLNADIARQKVLLVEEYIERLRPTAPGHSPGIGHLFEGEAAQKDSDSVSHTLSVDTQDGRPTLPGLSAMHCRTARTPTTSSTTARGRSSMAQPSCPTQNCAASPGTCTAIDCVKICSTSIPGRSHKACCKAGRCCCYN
ncbi:hypothetical protein Taro_037809 [Colocasia esculenta]|uniref:Uncharacterized protein n=1 Tax=Colocasia esculenta TaxID=4460 RepID=A0A843WHC2_COLES|nr:hypothetical protein [Colocasia esculenta]